MQERDDPLLRAVVGGVALRNPVILAAGTAGYVDELAGALDLSRVGAVVTKSITREAREGNAPWRVLETRAGMLNAIGLANVGAERFAKEFGPRLAGAACAVIGSAAGHSVEDYVAVAAMFDRLAAVPAVEVNVSCPNVAGGRSFGDTPASLGALLRAVRPALARAKMWVKLPPATQESGGIVDLARAAVEAGADALTIANTIPAMEIDVDSREPRLANITGGLSGPAVHTVVVRLVHLAYRHVARGAGVPIVGAGGVMTWRDAAELILAGASAVEVGTATFADPRAPGRIAQGLERWARREGVRSIGELVGAVRLPEQRP